MRLKNITLSFILLLFGLTLSAQDPLDPGWLWAESGGSSASFSGSSNADYSYERIVDVAVDGDNNYYYLAEVGGFSFTLGDMEFDTYNSYPSMRDIFVFSTDSEGNYRWSKVIGGGAGERAASLGIDGEGNIYVSGQVFNTNTTQIPVHFDTDSIRDAGTMTPGPKNKSAFLIKYSSEGDFQWLRMPEEDALFGRSGAFVKTIVEPNGQTHSLLWLGEGSYFNDALIVDEGRVQYVILNYNSNGTLEGFIPLDMKPDDQFSSAYYNYQLAYDPSLERYYIADTKRNYTDTISINGYGIASGNTGFYLAAVDNQGEVIWFHENNNISAGTATGDIQLDNNGNIYFTGHFNTSSEPDSFAEYVFEGTGTGSGINNPFLIKLDSDGNLLWGTNAQLYSPFNGQSIVVDDSNIYLGLGMLNNTWDAIDIIAPTGQGLVPDIQIIRFDAQTGVAQEVIHNNAITPTRDVIMAMALDKNGDLVVGGYFGSSLFAGTDLELNDTGPDSDFFIAKYQPQIVDVGVDNHDLENVKIYPNPTSGMIILQSETGLIDYTLYDLQGRTIEQGSLESNQIDLSGMESGVYVLRVRDNNMSVRNFKVVKE